MAAYDPVDNSGKRAADIAVGIVGLFLIAFVIYGACRMLSNSPDAQLDKAASAMKVLLQQQPKSPSIALPASIERCSVAPELLVPITRPSGYEVPRGRTVSLGPDGRPLKKIAILLSGSDKGTPCAWILWDGETVSVSKVDSLTGQPMPPTPVE
jgi:hypothetical protein